jgi:hypothetical protein
MRQDKMRIGVRRAAPGNISTLTSWNCLDNYGNIEHLFSWGRPRELVWKCFVVEMARSPLLHRPIRWRGRLSLGKKLLWFGVQNGTRRPTELNLDRAVSLLYAKMKAPHICGIILICLIQHSNYSWWGLGVDLTDKSHPAHRSTVHDGSHMQNSSI